MRTYIGWLILLVVKCGSLKMEELNPIKIAELPIGSAMKELNSPLLHKSYSNLPLQIPVFYNRLYVPDYRNAMIKVFSLNGNLEFIIGNPTINKNEKFKLLYQPFSSIGMIKVTADEDLFIQSFLSGSQEQKKTEVGLLYKKSGEFVIKEIDIAPSYIIQLDKKGRLQSIIGSEGKNSKPFRYIEEFYVGQKGKLFVYHRYAARMILTYFQNGEKKGSINETQLAVLQSELRSKYQIKLEKIIPHVNGDFLLASYAFFSQDEGRFKFKRIYKYYYNRTGVMQLLKEIKNPSDALFAVTVNGGFIVWETLINSESIKLQIHDKQGNYIYNKKITFPMNRSHWRQTYIDESDNIYSLYLNKKNLELYQWK